MRGKDVPKSKTYEEFGITPAYAGKSSLRVVTRYRPSGSPPPMRGKGAQYTKSGVPDRITPAYAGKSYSLP